MSSRNNNKNRWNDRDRDYNTRRNWNSDSRQNSSLQQRNWNKGEGEHYDNYGLGDTSQGSANYGHIDDGRGSRYYGTGNYGGYFGSGSDDYDQNRRHHQDRRGYGGGGDYYGNQSNRGDYSDSNYRSNDFDNYERGPRYGNSNIHGRSHEAGRESGIRYGSSTGYNRSGYGGSTYESGRNNDWNRSSRGRYSDYDSGRGTDWNQDRDWWDRTTDEVSSWFGDDEAARRREMDKKYGEHFGKGPKGFTRSDERIKEDAEEKLYHDSFIDATEIEVSVADGEITLSGTVNDKETKRRAEDCVEAVSGVKDVTNNLKVNRQSSVQYSSNMDSSMNKGSTGSLSENEQKLDQSRDYKRAPNK